MTAASRREPFADECLDERARDHGSHPVPSPSPSNRRGSGGKTRKFLYGMSPATRPLLADRHARRVRRPLRQGRHAERMRSRMEASFGSFLDGNGERGGERGASPRGFPSVPARVRKSLISKDRGLAGTSGNGWRLVHTREVPGFDPRCAHSLRPRGWARSRRSRESLNTYSTTEPRPSR